MDDNPTGQVCCCQLVGLQSATSLETHDTRLSPICHNIEWHFPWLKQVFGIPLKTSVAYVCYLGLNTHSSSCYTAQVNIFDPLLSTSPRGELLIVLMRAQKTTESVKAVLVRSPGRSLHQPNARLWNLGSSCQIALSWI